ncbi:MAG: hypothetical protein CVV02_17930 [Firmicutes bacterium HGW-Firmicutes-7]|nr:MAG: hypothetical protein CVV02_17930 [Firmicutes bacterium HGW-Firmicutes-7]
MEVSHVQNAYSKIASKYADEFYKELDNKPLDRYLLKAFCSMIRKNGIACDMGCGPGHITRYIHNRGINIIGMDISKGMIQQAKKLNPGIDFEEANMLELNCIERKFSGIISHYSIVHFEASELKMVFNGINSILEEDGLLLIAFHVGDEALFVKELLEEEVNMDYIFHNFDRVLIQLREFNFKVIEAFCREPYEGYEYMSRRGYILCKKGTEMNK